jgi:hypothetical protein
MSRFEADTAAMTDIVGDAAAKDAARRRAALVPVWLRIVAGLAVAIALLLQLGGKMYAETLVMPKDDAVKYEMRRHLEQKYGYIEFEESSFYHESIFIIGIGYRWNLYLAGGDPRTDDFFVYKDDKNRSIADSYYGLLIREDYEKMVKEVADRVFDDCKVYCHFQSYAFSDELTSDVDLAQALERDLLGINDPDAWIVVPNIYGTNEADFQKDAEAFIQGWGQSKQPLTIRVFCLNDKDYKLYSRKTYTDIFDNKLLCFPEYDAAFSTKDGERYQ